MGRNIRKARIQFWDDTSKHQIDKECSICQVSLKNWIKFLIIGVSYIAFLPRYICFQVLFKGLNIVLVMDSIFYCCPITTNCPVWQSCWLFYTKSVQFFFFQEEYEAGDELGRLNCEHSYHFQCIKQWVSQKNFCPVCKQQVAARHEWHKPSAFLDSFHLQICV